MNLDPAAQAFEEAKAKRLAGLPTPQPFAAVSIRELVREAKRARQERKERMRAV